MKNRIISVLIAFVISGAIGMTTAQEGKIEKISVLRKIYKGAANKAEEGDLIELGFETHPFDGPFNLKIAIRGAGVTFQVKPVIVFAPGPRPDPNKPIDDVPPDEVRAYFTVEGTGDVTLVVTPINPSHRPKKDPINIGKKGTLRFDAG